MCKVYLVCGKICSGKSYYIKNLQKEIKAVYLSLDEATYDLINNEQGDFYDSFSLKLISYMDKKAVEIVKAGANVIYERGLWTKKERETAKKYFKENGCLVELHYIHVNDEIWKKQIEKRNREYLEGKHQENFFVNEGLLKKVNTLFEEPSKNEVDVWIENKYYLN